MGTFDHGGDILVGVRLFFGKAISASGLSEKPTRSQFLAYVPTPGGGDGLGAAHHATGIVTARSERLSHGPCDARPNSANAFPRADSPCMETPNTLASVGNQS